MNDLIASFSQQLSEALSIGKNASLHTDNFVPKNVIISGMGGSGIGGTIIQNFATRRVNIPVITNKSYHLPAFADSHSLVIISSYSGNTEETLSALQEAVQMKCRIVCITSGGTIGQQAQEQGLDTIIVPGGMQPRACLGYSLVQLLFVLAGYGLIDYQFEAELEASIQLLDTEEDQIKKQAESLANWMKDLIPVLYVGESLQGVAVRWCQQINENGKSLCWHNQIPEMNHNEIEGWEARRNDMAVLMIRSEEDEQLVQRRIDIVEKLIRDKTDQVRQIQALGSTYLERALYLIHLGDWLSWYLSQAKQVNPNQVKMIDFLKSALSE